LVNFEEEKKGETLNYKKTWVWVVFAKDDESMSESGCA